MRWKAAVAIDALSLPPEGIYKANQHTALQIARNTAVPAPLKLPFAFRYVLPAIMVLTMMLMAKSLIEWAAFGQPFDWQVDLVPDAAIFSIAATVRFLGGSLIRWQMKQH